MLVIKKVFNPIKYATYSLAVVLVGGIASYSALNLFDNPKQGSATEPSQNSVNKTTPVQSSTPQPDSSSSLAAAAENYSAYTMLGTATSNTMDKPSTPATTSESAQPNEPATTPTEPTTTPPPVTTEPPATEPVIPPADPPATEPVVDPPTDSVIAD